MLNLNSQSDYGILLIAQFKDKKGFTPLSELTKKLNLPHRYLARIASTLAYHDVLESREGKEGGYRLSKKGREMDLYEYLKIFEGDLAMTKCQKEGYNCPWGAQCQHKGFLENVLQKLLMTQLKKYRLLEIIKK